VNPHPRLQAAAAPLARERIAPAPRAARPPWSPQLLRALRALAFPILALGLWQIVTATGLVRPLFLPPPSAVWREFSENGAAFLAGLQTSLAMVAAGLVVGGVAGIGTGLLLGLSPTLRAYVELSLDLIRPVPLFALIPLFVLWFGIGEIPEIALIALGIALLLSLATIEAVRNAPEIYVKAALTLGATRLQIYRGIIIPAIAPQMLGAVRYGVACAWGLDVAAEFTGSQKGLGYIMIVREQYLDTAGIFAVVLIFCAIAIASDRLLKALFRPLLRWQDSSPANRKISELIGR
jgi:ABC-type nitrate/sulfonate/bicarbonate transport system permease component